LGTAPKHVVGSIMESTPDSEHDGGRSKKLALLPGVAVVGLVGNPKPRSRTYQMVTAVAEAFATSSGGRVEALIDLVELKPWLFDLGAPEVQSPLERVLRADVLVVGSPVYKATYTGLLKAFCDHVAHGELAGTLALPTMMGGYYQHALAVDLQLRPLLVELGAICATPGLYVLESQVDELEAIANRYVEQLAESLLLHR
jgi:FMN reductase